MNETYGHTAPAGLEWLEQRVDTLLKAYVAAMDTVSAHFAELTALAYPSPRYLELAACTDDVKDGMHRAGDAYRAARADLEAARAEIAASRG